MTNKTMKEEGSIYLIHPLSTRDKSPHECQQASAGDGKGSYVTIKRVISASPNVVDLPESEIETVLEAFVSGNGECLWRRVAVWSGPASPQRVMHASFVLPTINDNESNFVVGSKEESTNDNLTTALLEQPSLVCWAAFPERPSHKLLCVLAGPSMLTLWDVYPDSDEVCVNGEGHSISLPFLCSSIHACGDGNGLLLQRQDDPEDLVSFQDVDMDKGRANEDESGFSQTPGSGRRGPSLHTSRTTYTNTAAAEVPSLFTLQHPLEDVLPVSLWSESSSLVTDVFEKIVHTATLRWNDQSSREQHKQTILVTYNTHRKRHAIWALREAPAQTTELLLWKRSRDRSSARTWDNHIGTMEQDLEEMHLLGMEPPQQDGPTRDEHLADALGLRRTPRKAGEATQSRRAIEPRTSLGREDTATANSSFLHTSTRSGARDSFMDTDISVSESTAQLLNLRPQSSLRPTIAIDCLYEEAEECAPAFNAFLSSNLAGSHLILALVTPFSADNQNQNLLRLYSLIPTLGNPDGGDYHFDAKVISSLQCVDAQPIQTTLTTPRFLSNERNRSIASCVSAIEILVLKRISDDKCSMGLHRAAKHIVDCALLDTKERGTSFITGISNPVRGSLDFKKQGEGKSTSVIRGCISLRLVSNALAEKVLAAVESAMFLKFLADSDASAIQFALKFRSDCSRLDQFEHEPTQQHKQDDWSKVASLLSAVFDFEYFGSSSSELGNANEMSESSGVQHKSPWEQLMNSSYHSKFSEGDLGAHFPDSFKDSTCLAMEGAAEGDNSSLPQSFQLTALECLQSGSSVAPQLFDALHYLYEDLKLSQDSKRTDELRSVGSLLASICSSLNGVSGSSVLQEFLAHYRKDLGADLVDRLACPKRSVAAANVGAPPKPTSFDSPPCILAWLDANVRNEADPNSVYSRVDEPTFNTACLKTKIVLKLFKLMSGVEVDDVRDQKLVSALRQEGFLSAEQVRDTLPSGAAVPILEVLHRCGDALGQSDVPGWGAVEYNLIRRSDLGHQHGFAPTQGLKRSSNNITNTPTNIPLIEDPDEDGIPPLQSSSAMLFPQDNRIKETGRLLRSSRPCPLSVPRGVEVSDHEYERLKQIKLLLLCRRALAIPVGRGMLTIGNFHSAAAEPLPVPDLCLAGRVAPSNANLALDVSECQTGFLNWPEFHNGVAAGLRLPLEGEAGRSAPKITRSWIVYNRPPNSDAQSQQQTNGQRSNLRSKIHAHGGLLLALGLRGHLHELEMCDLYDYLTQGQATLTCGVLLGMAANKRGSCDISVSKMLCLHLPSLMPQQFSAIDVASAVQTAAVAGTGLLFQGSSSRLMTEFLLNEIGKRPDSDVMLDREAYTLSCGLALGMINICKGDRIGKGQDGEGEGLADLRLRERLTLFISSGIDEGESNRTRETNDRLNAAMISGEQERCCCIFEGAAINVGVTAAGSTLALGLVYMKTGNQNITSVLDLPDTHTLLEYVRPDFLTLRVISKAMILWDSVDPSKKWIEDQLPSVIKKAYKQMRLKVKTVTDMGNVLHDDAMDLSPEMPTGKSDRSDGRQHGTNTNTGEQGMQIESEDYDCQVVRQIYVHVIAGACFGLGLRFAGTGDKRASAAIFERVVELQTLRDVNDSVSQSLRPEPQILETCLGCCAISLAMVNAGTGDLETLKLLKILRWRCDETVKFGGHMSFGIAIGLLFLGGGTSTLGREPQDIAAMIAAFFPRFPFSSTDNQYHLQPLRHLWALACKRRDVRFADVDTGEIVSVPVAIYYGSQDSNPLHLTAPCLVPNGEGDIAELRIVSDKFYPMTVKLGKDVFGRTLYVKRRTAHSLSSKEIGHQSLLGEVAYLQEYLQQGNPYVHALVQYLLQVSSSKIAQRGVSTEGFYRCILPECHSNRAEMTCPLYLRLWAATEANPSMLNLISSFYERFHRRNPLGSPPLLNPGKISYLRQISEKGL